MAPRFAVVSNARPLGPGDAAAAAHHRRGAPPGFDLCSARERPVEAAGGPAERQLEPLLPGFVCASAAMQRVADQIQRLQGNDLTVLDHRRERHRQGSGRARDSRRVVAPGAACSCRTTAPVHARAGRQSVVRTSPRQLHRRGRRPARRAADRGRWNAVPRRGRRPAARRPAEAAALPRAGRGAAGRRYRVRSGSTSGSSPRPTPTSNSASPTASSARTCSIVSA